MKFKDFVNMNEAFLNAVGDRDKEIKHKYKVQVWDLLQKSYSAIGGIKGNGFGSPDEMVQKIPFWKMITKDSTVHAVVLYKDKGGRKSVAMGSNGSDFAKKHLANALSHEMTRAYGEKSKSSLGMVLKTVPWDILEPYLHSPDVVAKTLKGDHITPIKNVAKHLWPADAKITLQRYPKLIDYGYMRDIGGNQVFKVMIGTINKKIV